MYTTSSSCTLPAFNVNGNRVFLLVPTTTNYNGNCNFNVNKVLLEKRIIPPPNPNPYLLVGPSAAFGSSDDCYYTVDGDRVTKEEEEEAAAAVEAVSEIIQEYGDDKVSKEESYEMALNSPNYVRMLVDAVRELNELEEISGVNNNNRKQESSPSFKEKVYEMGQLKGDKGIVPFLESIVGLSLPSAMHLSRSSPYQTLPQLILKVKYVKEMFFSDSSDDYDDDDDDGGRLGEIARLMMMRLSIPIDDDALQQTLSFFEKTQARRGGLDLFGSRDASFCHLIQSFPRLLLVPLEHRMKPLVEFLQGTGVPRRCMRHILVLYPPILFYDIERDIKPALAKVSAENKDFGRIILKYPWILSTSIQRNYSEIHSFFDARKVPKFSVDRAIKSWPYLLGYSIDKLKVMINQLAELGVCNKKLGLVIAKSPQLLLKKPQEFQQVVYFLKELGLDEATIGKILGRCPEIFATDIERILKKKLEFLTTIGVSKGYLPLVIRKYPELFVCDINKALLPRMKYLVTIGLSKRDVAFMVCRFSPILGYSIKEVLRPKVNFLVNTMRKPLRDVVEYPRYFSYSLEKKIEPRYWELKSRNLNCSLKDMLGKNDEEFAAEFMVMSPAAAAASSSSSSSPLVEPIF